MAHSLRYRVPDDQGSALIFSPSQLSQDVLCRCLCCGGWVCGSWGQASNQKTTRRLTAAGARFWLLPLLFSLSSVVPLSLTRCGCLCLGTYLAYQVHPGDQNLQELASCGYANRRLHCSNVHPPVPLFFPVRVDGMGG